jgi:hypothetical protein
VLGAGPDEDEDDQELDFSASAIDPEIAAAVAGNLNIKLKRCHI